MIKNTRIYPLRTSSDTWKIKLYSKHICNEDCKLAYIEEEVNEYSSITFVVDNPHYNTETMTCRYNHTLNESYVRLSNFQEDSPQTIDGDLLYDDHIVIPDTKIYIDLSFPLKEPKKISVESKDPLGFSLSYLIHTLQKIYDWVYEREEETCTEKMYSLMISCKCINEKNKFSTQAKSDNEDVCAICLEKTDSSSVEMICHHIFHKDCIDRWVNSSSKSSCPTCRSPLLNCGCEGKGILYENFIGKVIPREKRGITVNRNTTDGVFGIYGYDKDDLFLKYFVYNNITKTLYPTIFG
jgi:hypothetical protein